MEAFVEISLTHLFNLSLWSMVTKKLFLSILKIWSPYVTFPSISWVFSGASAVCRVDPGTHGFITNDVGFSKYSWLSCLSSSKTDSAANDSWYLSQKIVEEYVP